MSDELELYCSNCGVGALFTDAGERLPCTECGSMGITTEKREHKPYRLTRDDKDFLRCQGIKPE